MFSFLNGQLRDQDQGNCMPLSTVMEPINLAGMELRLRVLVAMPWKECEALDGLQGIRGQVAA